MTLSTGQSAGGRITAMTGPHSEVALNLARIQAEIADAAVAARRNPEDIALMAVSKFQPAAAVEAALAAGQRLFGENRVLEGAAKFSALRPAYPDLALHLIGPLQTNKVRDAVRAFDVIETVDRPKLAEALAGALGGADARVRAVLIEVNTGEEPQKAGIWPGEADAFIVHCRDTLRLPVAGLMAVPPVDEEASLHFALLREMARRHRLPVLSMGMSGDFAIAIGQGATQIRIGTAIFGARPAAADSA